MLVSNSETTNPIKTETSKVEAKQAETPVEEVTEIPVEKPVVLVKEIPKPIANVDANAKRKLDGEGEIPRFAFSEETLSKKIALPDLNNLDKPKDEGGIDEPILNIKEKKAITEELVFKVWNQYVEKLIKAGNISGEMLFKDRDVEVDVEKESIVVNLEHKVQLDSFEELKTELMFFLRQNLQNPDLKINAEVKKRENDSKRLYTDQDKLDYLIETNPLVKELKDKLGLDVDY